MRNLRNLCSAVVLALALTSPALAGNIHTGVTSTPPPQPASMTEGQTVTEQTDGTIHTGVAESEPETDTVAEIALNLLQSVLSLF